jgi:hypothetical protein
MWRRMSRWRDYSIHNMNPDVEQSHESIPTGISPVPSLIMPHPLPSTAVQLPASHKLFPMNFLFVKLNHHLLGRSLCPPAPSSNIRASSLIASSCRTCERYCFSVSASCRFEGGLNICGRWSVGVWFGWGERGGYLVEGEAGVTWDGEVGIESYVLDFFLGVSV